MPEHTLQSFGTCKHGSYGKCWICDEIMELKKDKAYWEEEAILQGNRGRELKAALMDAIYAITSTSPHYVGDSQIYTPQISKKFVDGWNKCLESELHYPNQETKDAIK